MELTCPILNPFEESEKDEELLPDELAELDELGELGEFVPVLVESVAAEGLARLV